ncbi:MAG: hypothetical protein IKM73_11525, partial [Acidaminococcaceae bacterium]|nr:hypothetical protein [Acidaminococcaceae bacterium]
MLVDKFQLLHQLVIDNPFGDKPGHRFQDPAGVQFFRYLVVVRPQVPDDFVVVIERRFNQVMDVLHLQDFVELGIFFQVLLNI